MVEDYEVNTHPEDLFVDVSKLNTDPLRVLQEGNLETEVGQVDEHAHEAQSVNNGLFAGVRVQLVKVSLLKSQALLLQFKFSLFEKSMCLFPFRINVGTFNNWINSTFNSFFLTELGSLLFEPSSSFANFFVSSGGGFVAVSVVDVIRVWLLARQVVVVALNLVVVRLVERLTRFRCLFKSLLLSQLSRVEVQHIVTPP